MKPEQTAISGICDWDTCRTFDYGEIDAGAVGGGAVPVHRDGEAGALVGLEAGMEDEVRVGGDLCTGSASMHYVQGMLWVFLSACRWVNRPTLLHGSVRSGSALMVSCFLPVRSKDSTSKNLGLQLSAKYHLATASRATHAALMHSHRNRSYRAALP